MKWQWTRNRHLVGSATRKSLAYLHDMKKLMEFLTFLQCFSLQGREGERKCSIAIADSDLLLQQ